MSAVLFIHHRSMRLVDNRGLIEAVKQGPVISIFIFTPEQISENPYFSPKSFGFLVDSLLELRDAYRSLNQELWIFYGSTNEVVSMISDQISLSGVVINSDFTPYAEKRKQALENLLSSRNIPLTEVWDSSLVDLSQVQPQSGSGYYQVFTPFYNNLMKRDVSVDSFQLTSENFYPMNSEFPKNLTNEQILNLVTDRGEIPAGRNGAIEMLKRFFESDLAFQYQTEKDRADFDTSWMSPHIKYGTVSIREVFQTAVYNLGKHSEYVRQLIWHDFYASLMKGLPSEQTYGDSNYRELKVEWNPNEELFSAWSQGQTGFPFIDAAMRQLASTGWMQNRGRLAVSNFLVFGLKQNWKWGEWWFATHLVDYDPASNNGNWQWSAQVGIDRPRGYPRVYNLERYSREHDPEGQYIRKWVPELAHVETDQIHRLSTISNPQLYLSHIVDYEANQAEMKTQFKQLVKS